MMAKSFRKMFYNRIKFFTVAILLLPSCGDSGRPAGEEERVVTDVLGREVVVPENIESVVGLRAGALRLLVYMDAVPLIVGIEEPEKRDSRPYTEAYPRLKELPAIGPSMGGDPEMIMNAEPDVIFKTYTTASDADQLQAKTGIPVIALECTDLGRDTETLLKSLEVAGNVIQREERADSLASYIRQTISELDARTKDIAPRQKPSVYVGGISYSGSYGLSATHHRFAPFLLVNANNVAAGIDSRLTSHVRGTFVDIEKIMYWDPDYIFVDKAGLSLVARDLETKPALAGSLKAVENEKIFTLLPYNNYATNYEYVILNSWFTGKLLYPERFEDVDFDDITTEVLEMFYNREADMADSFKVFKRLSGQSF